MTLMEQVTGTKPKMWGNSIVGFGSYHYKYKSGREGDWFVTGFAPRKRNLVVYIMPGFGNYQGLTSQLGRHKTAVSCLYLNRLEDVDLDVLGELITRSVRDMQSMYACR